MSFRQYGGINYAARNNIVKNNYTNANNLSIMNKVGQTNSIINVDSGLYMSSNLTFKNMNGPYYGITFSDGTTQRSATTTTDTYWQPYDSAPTPVIYYTNQVIVGADPYVTGGTLDSGTKLAVNGNVSISNSTSGKAGVIQMSDYSITPTATCRIASYAGKNYIESGVNSNSGSSAPLYFTNFNGANTWMTINSSGNVGIGTTTPAYKLDVNGTLGVSGATTLNGGLTVKGTATPLISIGTSSSNQNIFAHYPDCVTGSINPITVSGDNLIYLGDNSSSPGNSVLSIWSDAVSSGLKWTGNASLLLGMGGPSSTPSNNITFTAGSTNSTTISTNGTIKMTISSTGNVGIGTTTPAYKLDVNGTMNVTGVASLGAGSTVPSPATSDNSTKIATTAFVKNSIVVNSIPSFYFVCINNTSDDSPSGIIDITRDGQNTTNYAVFSTVYYGYTGSTGGTYSANNTSSALNTMIINNRTATQFEWVVHKSTGDRTWVYIVFMVYYSDIFNNPTDYPVNYS